VRDRSHIGKPNQGKKHIALDDPFAPKRKDSLD